MDYRIADMPGAPAREIAAFQAGDDVAARTEAHRLADHGPGLETIDLYEGGRPVLVLANLSLCFRTEPLAVTAHAA